MDGSDNESDAGGERMLMPAFPVDDAPDFDPTAVPTSGEEFLRLVRYEARQCPDIMVARNIDPRAFDSKQTVRVPMASSLPATPEARLPSPSWQHQTVATFVDVRQFLKRTQLRPSSAPSLPSPARRLPKATDKAAWRALCLAEPTGQDTAADTAEVESTARSSSSDNAALPSVVEMGLLDQATVAQVLGYNSEWSKDCQFTARQGIWLYALLCCLDTVMTGGVTATLRDLCRHLVRQRAKLDDGDPQALAGLNVIIVLIGDFFRQRDLLEV